MFYIIKNENNAVWRKDRSYFSEHFENATLFPSYTEAEGEAFRLSNLTGKSFKVVSLLIDQVITIQSFTRQSLGNKEHLRKALQRKHSMYENNSIVDDALEIIRLLFEANSKARNLTSNSDVINALVEAENKVTSIVNSNDNTD